MNVNQLITLGSDAFNTGDWDASIKHFKKVLQYDKNNTKALNNLGCLFYTINKLSLSHKYFDRAAELSPNDYSIRVNKSLTTLKSGDLDGFKDYRYRWFLDKGIFPGIYVSPENRAKLWNGQDLTGKTILLWEEGGYGDIIQFMRYANCFDCRVLVGVRELQSLYSGFEAYTGQHYDYHCPLMNIPAVINRIPPPNKLNFSSTIQLKTDKKLNVGIVWRSANNKGIFFGMRNMHHENVKPLFELNAQLHCLQIDLSDEEKQFIEQNNISTYNFKDWNQTTALVDQLDVVVSIDTSIAHLAGTLGKPTFLTIPFTGEWRWLLNTNKSEWYPSMTIFRQKEPGDWKTVMKEVAINIQNFNKG